MKKKRSVLHTLLVIGLFAMATKGYAQKAAQKRNPNPETTPNGNYKHAIPVSEGHTFKENFTKAETDSVNRNYKQQNQKKGTVKFRDHFKNPGKKDHRTYKDQEGL